MRRLDELMNVDVWSRWRMISVSALSVAFWGSLKCELLKKPVRDVQVEALVFGVIVLLFQVLTYCKRVEASERPPNWTAMTIISRRLAMSALGSSVLVFLAVLPAPSLEGAILDRRLRKLSQRVPLSSDSIKQIADAFGGADRLRVRIPASTSRAISAALKETSEADPALSEVVFRAEVALASNLTNKVSPQLQSIVAQERLRIEATGGRWAFVPIATNLGPDNYQTTEVSRQPDVARMELIENPLPKASDYGPGFLIVRGLITTLDGYRLKRVVFENMKLFYRGGPLVLEQVYFYQCSFEIEPGPSAARFVATINSADGVSFSTK